MTLQNGLLVAAGGAIGSVLRYAVALLAIGRWGPGFPWGTLIVNVVGCFAIGAIAELATDGLLGMSPNARLFLATGICGGFTTFSSFGLDALQLTRAGALAGAFAYVAGSLILGLAAVYAGVVAARLVVPHP
ncbi:MAG TPA: fluoride efflux transporter CrcB [Candidatus Sulfotelmatobacter sp.]|nr:fluoride efflux transporter CrcB [Candidatus Sulfotelmatobacter sp.]